MMNRTLHKLFWIVLTLAGGWLEGRAPAQVALGVEGTVTMTFDTAPTSNEWRTQSFGGDNGGIGIVSAGQLDAAVQLVDVAAVNRALAATAVFPPSQNNYTRWNSTARNLQSRIGNVEFTVALLTLSNAMPWDLSRIELTYDLGGGLTSTEHLPGFHVYYSFTGTPNSWTALPDDLPGVTGPKAWVIGMVHGSLWPVGALLHVLWADDNGPGSDGYYTLDNVSVSVRPRLRSARLANGSVEVMWPAGWSDHRLEWSPSLTAPDWQPVPGFPESSGGWNRVVVEAGGEQRFFRTSSPGI